MATLTFNGRTLAFEREGAGPTIVMLNGFAAAKADWDPTFVAKLAERHELVRLDNRGVGESPSDGQPFTVDDLADDVAGALDALELDRPAILGWSMGGFVAQALAVAQPERVGRLILLSTRAAGDTSALPTAEAREKLLDFSGTPREQASRLISLLFTPERAAVIDEQFGDIVAAARAALPAETIGQQKLILGEWGRRAPCLADIGCPTLAAAGREDVVVPPANAERLAAGVSGSWLALFPSAGHGFMADHPESLAALISSFLDAYTP